MCPEPAVRADRVPISRGATQPLHPTRAIVGQVGRTPIRRRLLYECSNRYYAGARQYQPERQAGLSRVRRAPGQRKEFALISNVGRGAMLSLVCALLVSPFAAHAGGWFFHKFGELRAYHADFLNVCAEAGHGQCRTVQHRIPRGGATFFGDARLSVKRLAENQFVIEIFVRGLPSDPQGPMTIMVDGKVFLLNPAQWRVGEQKYSNVAETFHVHDATLNAKLIARMKRGRTMRVIYEGGSGHVDFSLRGFSAAVAAIEQLVQSR